MRPLHERIDGLRLSHTLTLTLAWPRELGSRVVPQACNQQARAQARLRASGRIHLLLKASKESALMQQPGRGAKAAEVRELVRILAAHRKEHVPAHVLRGVVGGREQLQKVHAT